MVDVPAKKRRLRGEDWGRIADWIYHEYFQRKSDRKDHEDRWKEVDRQVAMIPARAQGNEADPRYRWMPSLELPWQAETLEILNADARRLIFPPDREWFTVAADLSGDNLAKLEFDDYAQGGPADLSAPAIDQMGPQSFANALIQRTLEWLHETYDRRGAWDLLNGEAFKYGTFVGRVRKAKWPLYSNEFRGIYSRDLLLPVVQACSLKNTYLDDAPTRVLNEGMVVEPSFIRWWKMDVLDLALAAAKGSPDPTSEEGGWMQKAVANLEGDKDGNVELLEYEGDLVLDRSSGPAMFMPNVIVTVACGATGGKEARRVVRYREKEFPFRSYFVGYYHRDSIDSVYGVSPLIKGYPVQKAASDALCRAMAAAALATQPPVWYDLSDFEMLKQGGPLLEPAVQWATMTKPEMIGKWDVSAIFAVYTVLKEHYEQVTGTSAPRGGEQTKSHQTKGAVDTEITRGLVRTVDYVRSVLQGPMPTTLHMEYEILRTVKGKHKVYIPEARGFVEVAAKQLPASVQFSLYGAGMPAQEQQDENAKIAALKAVLEIEPIAVAMGASPADIDGIRRYLVRKAGLDDNKFIPPRAGAGTGGMAAIAPGGSPVAGLGAMA